MKTSIIKTVTLLIVTLSMIVLQGCSQFETPLEIPATGTIQIITTSEAKCTLYTANNLVAQWTGSKVIYGMKAGSYRVTITSEKFNSSFEESFELGVGEQKNLEPGTGRLDIKVKSNFNWELTKNNKLIFSGEGSLVIDTLWTGDYSIKIKVNPLLPDYETSFTLSKQQTKVVEPLLGGFTIKTKSNYQNSLYLEGVEQFSWTGSKEFNPWLAGNYLLKSKMFSGAATVNKSFTIQPKENKTIEWDYGNINISAPGSISKLKREGIEQAVWQGNNSFDSLIVGNYTVEIQEPNRPIYSKNFTLSKDEQKNIAIPYATIEVISNVPTSRSKLTYNGDTITTLTGSGTISGIVPGNYKLTVEASGYTSQTENISLSNGQTLQKNIQLALSSFIAMIYIPAGTFTMGCTSEQSNNCFYTETPIRQITLSAYEIGKYEVTQKEWRTVMGSNPSSYRGDNLPVEQVTWYDAITFCNTLSIREGLTPVYTVNGSMVTANWSANGFRLPTEAEWENAARGGASSTNTRYSGSNTISSVAWYTSNSGNRPHDVGTKDPNQLGIYDMSGNITEWCWDWYRGDYYQISPGTNPRGPDSGDFRVERGGHCSFEKDNCRVAYRSATPPSAASYLGGFRLARTR